MIRLPKNIYEALKRRAREIGITPRNLAKAYLFILLSKSWRIDNKKEE